MKLIDVGSGDEMVEQVNAGVDHAVTTIVEAITQIVNEADNKEYMVEVSDDLAVTITTVPAVEFPALHAVHQLGQLDPAVVAAGDSDGHPVVLVVDSAERVRHDPDLKRLLETNAEGLIACLGHGLWHFQTVKTPQGVGLELLNPRLLGEKPALLFGVDDKRITVSEAGWGGEDNWHLMNGEPCYVRDADNPHLASWPAPDADDRAVAA